MRQSKKITVGILAHVDAGKTTLSEALLYLCGEIKKMGRVDYQDAFLDTNGLERERGITIFSKQARMKWRETEIILLDTPGHVDFSAEMERTLQVLDYAVLVVSGSDGVQGHTETLWKLLEKYQVPVFLFVNKMDLAGAEKERVLAECKERFSQHCVDFSEENSGLWLENVAVCADSLLEKYLEQGMLELPEDLQTPIRERKLFPCYFGTALRLEGVEELLNGIAEYTSAVEYGEPFAARVYKIARDAQGNRLTYLKITGGELPVKMAVTEEEKVNQIRLYSGDKYKTTDVVRAGEVCAVTGLDSTWPGQGLGVEEDFCGEQLEPVFNVQIQFPPETNLSMALKWLKQIEEEEPKLHIVWNEKLRQIFVQPMGQVQLEVLKRMIQERFGLDVEFGEAGILYRETICNTVEGVGHFEPLRHYAEVHLKMEPLPPGSGLIFDTDCSEDELDLNWQRLVLTHLNEKEHIGVLTGSPITDMRITLVGGRAHLKHTEGGDFRQAVYRAVRQGLMQAESILLEPYFQFTLEVPMECIGRAMTDIKRMCGEFETETGEDGKQRLTGKCPASEMSEYQTEMVSYTGGRGHISCSYGGYRPCHNAEKIIEAMGYDCLADVENTPDSVFCSHGSGFVVKWDEVKNYSHVESVLDVRKKNLEAGQEVHERQASSEIRDDKGYDKELQAIFERTFGPVKRRTEPAATRVIEGRQQKKYVGEKKRQPVEEYLLVDGYNIIFAWKDLKELSEVSLDAARMKLMDMMCNYQGYTDCRLIVVFDAYKVKGNPGSIETFHNISVVYTKEAETADMYIEKTTKKIASKHRVRVATSDGLEQMIILGHGALRISASAFREEVERINERIRGECVD